MAGAVEKRKATLAAKKAAQAVADQRIGLIAPKPKKPLKKDGHEPQMSTSSAFTQSFAQSIPGMGFLFPT